MIQSLCPVVRSRQVAPGVHVLTFRSDVISSTARAGQFLNIRAEDTTDPLLRRPFSVYRTEGDLVEVLFNVIGRGTTVLSRKLPGDMVDVLGPLGKPFTFDDPEFSTGILIGGGLGVVPLPMATAALKAAGKSVITFLGARTASAVVDGYLDNLQVATDDGTRGFHGTVVDLARAYLDAGALTGIKLFACGPTPMLKAVAALAREKNLLCEVSLEGPMACGFGICQGCPVELRDSQKKYALMCKDGPTFDIRFINL